MTKLFGLMLSGMMLFTSPTWAAENAAQKKAMAEVDKAIHDVAALRASTKVDEYFPYYVDDVSMTGGPAGWTTKQKFATGWRGMVERTGGLSKAEPTELRIQASPSGDAALASYVLKCVRLKPNEGQDPNVAYNMTETWFKVDGKWRIQGLTYSVAKDSVGPLTALKAQ